MCKKKNIVLHFDTAWCPLLRPVNDWNHTKNDLFFFHKDIKSFPLCFADLKRTAGPISNQTYKWFAPDRASHSDAMRRRFLRITFKLSQSRSFALTLCLSTHSPLNSAAKRLSCLPTYEGKSNAHSVCAHSSLFTLTHTGGSHYDLSAVIQ